MFLYKNAYLTKTKPDSSNQSSRHTWGTFMSARKTRLNYFENFSQKTATTKYQTVKKEAYKQKLLLNETYTTWVYERIIKN